MDDPELDYVPCLIWLSMGISWMRWAFELWFGYVPPLLWISDSDLAYTVWSEVSILDTGMNFYLYICSNALSYISSINDVAYCFSLNEIKLTIFLWWHQWNWVNHISLVTNGQADKQSAGGKWQAAGGGRAAGWRVYGQAACRLLDRCLLSPVATAEPNLYVQNTLKDILEKIDVWI